MDSQLGDLVSYRTPSAGMFLWCSLRVPAPSLARLLEGMREHGVCVLPGAFASASKGAASTSALSDALCAQASPAVPLATSSRADLVAAQVASPTRPRRLAGAAAPAQRTQRPKGLCHRRHSTNHLVEVPSHKSTQQPARVGGAQAGGRGVDAERRPGYGGEVESTRRVDRGC